MKDQLIKIIKETKDQTFLSYIVDCISKYGRQESTPTKNTNWRDNSPTDRQVETIRKIAAKRNIDVDIPKTKGECSDLISSLLEGNKPPVRHGNNTSPLSDEATDAIETSLSDKIGDIDDDQPF